MDISVEREGDIQNQIEDARLHMIRLADELGHVHPTVLTCSQKLDKLVLKYYLHSHAIPTSVLSRNCL